MSDTPKFTVVDRRKFRAEEDTGSSETPKPAAKLEAIEQSEKAPENSGPRLTLVEPSGQTATKAEPSGAPAAVEDLPGSTVVPIDSAREMAAPRDAAAEGLGDTGPDEATLSEPGAGSTAEAELPPAPSSEESRFQKMAYDKAAERLEDLVRAQNPAAPAAEKIGFEHLVQQLYLSAMMQMGAGTPEGQRPRIDILGARQTIDLLDVVSARTQGNLNAEEERTLSTVLYELRMTFLELTRMITAPQPPPIPPPPGSKLGLKPGARR